jgi:hypothetical protein
MQPSSLKGRPFFFPPQPQEQEGRKKIRYTVIPAAAIRIIVKITVCI